MTEAELKAIEQRAKAEIEDPWNHQSESLAKNAVTLIAEVRRLQMEIRMQKECLDGARQHIEKANSYL